MVSLPTLLAPVTCRLAWARPQDGVGKGPGELGRLGWLWALTYPPSPGVFLHKKGSRGLHDLLYTNLCLGDPEQGLAVQVSKTDTSQP